MGQPVVSQRQGADTSDTSAFTSFGHKAAQPIGIAGSDGKARQILEMKKFVLIVLASCIAFDPLRPGCHVDVLGLIRYQRQFRPCRCPTAWQGRRPWSLAPNASSEVLGDEFQDFDGLVIDFHCCLTRSWFLPQCFRLN